MENKKPSIDFSKFEKINDEAYVWRNFLDEEISDAAFQQSWELSQDPDRFVREGIELLGNAMDQRIIDKVEDFFKDTGYEIKYFLHWYTPPHLWFGIHRDDEAPDITPIKKAYGGVLYLSEMNGGELFYPTNNTKVQPHKGDLILHTAGIPHGATGVDGDNKRTITFVVYDPTIKVDPDDYFTSEKYLAEFREKQIFESKEFLESELGQVWLKKFWPHLLDN